MIQVEAVLCEDQRSVALYHYSGDDLLCISTQPLPMPITEEAFEEIRPEWETAWETAGA